MVRYAAYQSFLWLWLVPAVGAGAVLALFAAMFRPQERRIVTD